MAIEVIMPKAGMDMEEGTIIKWLKKEGDKVEKGEPLIEIATDKVNMEVEAEVSGTLLKILTEDGQVLPVFTVIGYIGEAGEDVSGLKAENMNGADKENIQNIVAEPEVKDDTLIGFKNDSDGKVRATPAARKLAREKGISIALVKGSGPKGRIQLTDVQNHVESVVKPKATPLAAAIAEDEGIELSSISGTGVSGKIMKNDVLKMLHQEEGANEVEKASEDRKVIPLTGVRKVIAERMTQSYFTAPVVTLNIEVDMTNTIALREKFKDAVLKETGCKMTFTDIFIYAVTKALKKYPIVNATLVEEGILINNDVNMGIAVGTEKGLFVPVIRNTDEMTLSEIVAARTDIVGRTLDNKIKPDEMKGSTFTVSNLGMFETVSFTSIINQPNTAILSIGAILERVRVVKGEPKVRRVMNMSITIDHRVVDGMPGAQFLQYLKNLLEEPVSMLF